MHQYTVTVREDEDYTQLVVFERDEETGLFNGYLVRDFTDEDGDSLVEKLGEFSNFAEDMLPWALSIVQVDAGRYDKEPVA